MNDAQTRTETQEPAMKLLYSRKEAASLLSISVRSLDYLITQDRIKTRCIGGRILLSRRVLEAFANGSDVDPIVPG